MVSRIICSITISAIALTYVSAAFSPGISRSGFHEGSRLIVRTKGGDAESENDEEIIRLLRGPLGATTRTRTKAIYIVSDTTGGTAKSAVARSLVQFNGCDDRFVVGGLSDDHDEECELLQTKYHTFCRTEQDVANVIKKAAQHQDAMLVYTFADPGLRESTARMCELEGLIHLDLLGPMFAAMETFFDRKPIGRPSTLDKSKRRRRSLSDSYYRRIEAVEFTLKADDGMSPELLAEADVIITGVSRTGKTPLSVVLSQAFDLKVANVPLMPEVPPPKQLLGANIDSRRVFCLTLNPADLQRIRKSRLKRELDKVQERDGSQISNYADRAYLMKDLMNAKRLTDDHKWTEIDVTGRAVEETASLIASIMNERFADQN